MRKSRNSFLLMLAIWLLSQATTLSGAAKTYYVATTGSDSNSGTQALPFKTIQKAASLALAGDTVLVKGGSYKERILINRSGTSSAKITFKAQPNTGIVYLKNPTTTFPVNQGVFELYYDSYIRIEGFYFKDSPADHAIIMQDTNSNIDFKTVLTTVKGNEVINNTFENIGNAGTGSSTVLQIGRAQDILVQGNTFINCYGIMVNIVASYRITVNSNSMAGIKGSAFTWTTQLLAIGIWHTGGGALFTPGSGILSGGFNTYDSNHIYSPSSGDNKVAIRLDAKAHNTGILRNRVHNFDAGIYLESGVSDCLIKENLSYNNRLYGFNTASSATAYPSVRHMVINNVAYNNGRHGFCIRKVEQTTFKNNTSFNNGVTQIMTTAQSVGTGNVFKYNLWYSSTNSKVGLWNCPLNVWNGKLTDSNCIASTVANKTLSEWVAASGETKSISANPLFAKLTAGSEDFHLQSSSPACLKGEGGVDMGAYPSPSTQLITSVDAGDASIEIEQTASRGENGGAALSGLYRDRHGSLDAVGRNLVPGTSRLNVADKAIDSRSIFRGVQAGTSKILIPSAANFASFSSSLILSNTGTSHTVALLTAYDISGAILAQMPLSIAPRETLKFENVLQMLGVTDNYGPIEVSSLDDAPLVARSQLSGGGKVVSFFEGLSHSAASLTQVIPLMANDADDGASLGINNPSNESAQVTVRLVGASGTELGVTSATVPAKGLLQMQKVVRSLGSAPGKTSLDGYLQVESSQPVHSWISRIAPITQSSLIKQRS